MAAAAFRWKHCAMLARLRQSHHVLGAFAFMAVLLHVGFWVACAQQAPQGLSRADAAFGDRGFFAALCTPDGALSVADPLQGGNQPPPGTSDCPVCALACGVHAAEPLVSAQPVPPSVVAFVVPSLPAARFPAQSVAFRTNNPRAPPRAAS